MKKFLYLSIVCIFTLVSCNKEQINNDTATILKNNQEVIEFCTQIDSLNTYYSSLCNINSTRGYIFDYKVGSCADSVGKYIGGKICSWIGGAIGVACGNPAITYGGIVLGKHFGSYAGSAVASIGAAWLIKNCISRADTTPSLVLAPNYIVPIEDYNNLTDGELHNIILMELLNNIDKYILSDGSLDYELLLDDAYIIENKYAPIENFDLYKEYWKPLVLEQTKRIVNESILLDNVSSDAFLDGVYSSLIPELQITREEFDNANLLNEKVLSTYIILDDATLVEFSKKIDYVIETSELDTELKSELKISNSVLTNSSLIWREVQ